MALESGTRLGVYEILSLLGSGGMGEVYRSKDTKLGREVALKILPASFTTDPDRVSRFRREAQVLASLNHPHIAQIYGLDEANGTQFLVLELVDGESLDKRIARARIPVDEALRIAKQIVEALEAAHEKGVIHRDLKPANIALTQDGNVKVLDFGLAKAVEPTGTSSIDATASPTITTPAMMTGIGVILGTAAYMSPEQAKGRAADKRSDIWAFGCVLYEMLTGKRAFGGEDVSDTLAFILTKSPAWDALPVMTPASIRRLLQRSLERDRKRRLADISDARLEIDEPFAPSATGLGAASGIVGAQSRSGWFTTLPWAVAAALGAGLAVALAMWVPWRKPSVSSAVRLSAEIGADVTLGVSGAPSADLALSPDGKVLVFGGQGSTGFSQLYTRRVDQLQASALSGTDEARNPFFSPDGQWIGFFAGGKLKKTSITGGAAVTLCDAPSNRGATWGEDGTIVFQPEGRAGTSLLRVSDRGGKPEPFTTLADGEVSQRWAQLLPGGKAVLFTTGTPGRFEDGNIVVQPLPNGPRKIVLRGGYYGRVVRSGHLLYTHGGTLFAVPFDFERLEIAGRPAPVLEGINTNSGTGATSVAVSNTGTLVYLAGQGVGNELPMVWLDHTGKTTPLRATPADWSHPRFSPDGTRLAMDIVGTGGGLASVWVYDWTRDTPTRLTFGRGADFSPVWTQDGRRIAFASSRASNSGGSGAANLYWLRADGTGDAQRLTVSTLNQRPSSWHPNGRELAITEADPKTGLDITIVTVEGDEASGWKPGPPKVFLNSPSNEQDPQFSPDGRWMAYSSDESGQAEVYVRPYPSSVGKWQISTGGGRVPTWSRTRPELFYITPTQQIMVASYTTEGGSFKASKTQAWWPGRIALRPRYYPYALHPDGNRFAVSIAPDATSKQDHVVFVFNFFDELRRLAPR